jgi:hypothetical protein
MLNAQVAGAYRHESVQHDGGGTCCFQKLGELFQSGTRQITRTNLVLIRSEGNGVNVP